MEVARQRATDSVQAPHLKPPQQYAVLWIPRKRMVLALQPTSWSTAAVALCLQQWPEVMRCLNQA